MNHGLQARIAIDLNIRLPQLAPSVGMALKQRTESVGPAALGFGGGLLEAISGAGGLCEGDKFVESVGMPPVGGERHLDSTSILGLLLGDAASMEIGRPVECGRFRDQSIRALRFGGHPQQRVMDSMLGALHCCAAI